MECIICLSSCETFYFEYNCTHKYCLLCFLKIVFFQNKTQCLICKTSGAVFMHITKLRDRPQHQINTTIKEYSSNIKQEHMKYKKEIKDKFNINLDLFCRKEDYNLLLQLFDYKCILCFKRFNTKYNLIEHIKTHGYVTCNICILNCHLLPFEYPLFKPYEVKMHKKGLPVNIFTASLVETELLKNRVKFKTETKYENLNGHPECNFCEICFYDEFMLKDHCNEHHYICKLCLKNRDYKYFKTINDLKGHNLEMHKFLDWCLKNINNFKAIKDTEMLFVADDIHFMEHSWKAHKKKISINLSEKKNSNIISVDPFYLKQEGVVSKINYKNEKFLKESLIKQDLSNIKDLKEDNHVKFVPVDLNRKNFVKVNIKIPLKSKNTTEVLSSINDLTIKYKNSDLSFKDLVDAFKSLISNGEVINLISTYRSLFEELRDEKVFEKYVEDLKFPPFESTGSGSKVVIKKTAIKNHKTQFKFIDLTK